MLVGATILSIWNMQNLCSAFPKHFLIVITEVNSKIYLTWALQKSQQEKYYYDHSVLSNWGLRKGNSLSQGSEATILTQAVVPASILYFWFEYYDWGGRDA